MFIELSGLQKEIKRWDEVNDDIVNMGGIGRKVWCVTVADAKNNPVSGYGGVVTLHFGVGEESFAFPESYDEKKDVYIDVYQ